MKKIMVKIDGMMCGMCDTIRRTLSNDPVNRFYYFENVPGKDECNFHLMSKERAKEIGFVKSPAAK